MRAERCSICSCSHEFISYSLHDSNFIFAALPYKSFFIKDEENSAMAIPLIQFCMIRFCMCSIKVTKKSCKIIYINIVVILLLAAVLCYSQTAQSLSPQQLEPKG